MRATRRPTDEETPSRRGLGRLLATGPVVPAIVALLVGGASAAGLGGLTSAALGAGSTSVSRCDANGFTYSYTVSVGVVTAVVVGGIADPACEGGNLQLTLVDGGGADIGNGSGAVAVDGDSLDNLVTVSLSVQPSLTTVAGVHAAITGP